jgi:hypothetical protein
MTKISIDTKLFQICNYIDTSDTTLFQICFILFNTQLYMCSGHVHDPTSHFFSQPLFLYVNLASKGAQKLFKTLAPCLQYWVSLTFADAYNRK